MDDEAIEQRYLTAENGSRIGRMIGIFRFVLRIAHLKGIHNLNDMNRFYYLTSAAFAGLPFKVAPLPGKPNN
jgi:hypothetical protein